MWGRVQVTTPATALPVLVMDLKTHMRVENDDENALLPGFLAAAIAAIDGPNGLGVAMMAQSWTLTLDGFAREIRLPGWPVKSVTAITYLDADGLSQTVASDVYRLDAGRDPARVYLKNAKAWPAHSGEPGAVQIEYVLGETDRANVPADLGTAVRLLAAHYFENREVAIIGTTTAELPLGVQWVFDRYRRGVVA